MYGAYGHMVDSSDFIWAHTSPIRAHQLYGMYVLFVRHIGFWHIYGNNMEVDVVVGCIWHIYSLMLGQYANRE